MERVAFNGLVTRCAGEPKCLADITPTPTSETVAAMAQ